LNKTAWGATSKGRKRKNGSPSDDVRGQLEKRGKRKIEKKLNIKKKGKGKPPVSEKLEGVKRKKTRTS